jgi:hypothetical protein
MLTRDMAQGIPLWLRLVLRVERSIGKPVESAVHSGTYFDLVAELSRTKAKLTGTVEGVSKRVWHLANLPAGTDIRRMRQQLAGVERRLIQLSKELEEQRAALDDDGARTSR